ncbi:MAG: lipoprotein-releasing ABC transporter permease subunit [Acidobacteria bacterium]|nr:lipoprotein-releasing ABC transporter permease subunit [Acidobacteriota bacterium]
MDFELFVALRYLRAKRKVAVISVITALSVLGIAAGVTALIVALAINNGFRQDLQGRLLGATAHVNVQRQDGEGIRDWRSVLAKLGNSPHVLASAPALYGTVLVSHANRSSQMILKGVDASAESKVGNLLDSVREGSAAPLNAEVPAGSEPPVVIGKRMADTLGASPGDSVLLISPQGHLTPLGLVPRYQYFRVAGVFDSGFYEFDSSWAFTNIRAAQQLLGLSDVVSVLEFKIDDIYRAAEVGADLQRQAGNGFGTTNWMEQNRALFSALKMEKRVTFITIGIVVCIAALNILISLIMMVMEKVRDIAILVSLGAQRQQIRNIFMLQGVMIGCAGTVLGLIGGYLLSWLGSAQRLIELDPNIYSISYVPFNTRATDAIWVAGMALLISFLATLYPAWSAASITPAEALRYE